MAPQCNPALAQIGRLLVICPEPIRVQCGVDESDMEEFDGKSFLRFFPQNYTPVWKNKIEWMGTTSLPKVSVSRYGFNAKISDERRELYYALQQIVWNSLSTTLPQATQWQPITVVDFAYPSIPGYEAGTDPDGYRYQVRYGTITMPESNLAVRGAAKDGYSLSFSSYEHSLRPG